MGTLRSFSFGEKKFDQLTKMGPKFRIHSSGIAVTGSQDQDNCATECYLLQVQGPGARSPILTYFQKETHKK